MGFFRLMYVLDRKGPAANASGWNFRRGCGSTPTGVVWWWGGDQIFKICVSSNDIHVIWHFPEHVSIPNGCETS